MDSGMRGQCLCGCCGGAERAGGLKSGHSVEMRAGFSKIGACNRKSRGVQGLNGSVVNQDTRETNTQVLPCLSFHSCESGQ